MTSLINLGGYPKKITRCHAYSGKKDKIAFKYEYSEKHGCPRRVQNGKVNFDDMIQSYSDDVDFKAIGKMLVDTRDNVVSHFDLNGEVMDVTGLPRNIHEYEALHNKMKSEYEKLPDDLKTLFNNDFDQFSKSWKTGQIGSVMDTYYKSLAGGQVTEEKKEEVKQ